MSYKSVAAIKTEINDPSTGITTNGVERITAPVLNAFMIDMADSYTQLVASAAGARADVNLTPYLGVISTGSNISYFWSSDNTSFNAIIDGTTLGTTISSLLANSAVEIIEISYDLSINGVVDGLGAGTTDTAIYIQGPFMNAGGVTDSPNTERTYFTGGAGTHIGGSGSRLYYKRVAHAYPTSIPHINAQGRLLVDCTIGTNMQITSMAIAMTNLRVLYRNK